jgi:hypothetical protein
MKSGESCWELVKATAICARGGAERKSVRSLLSRLTGGRGLLWDAATGQRRVGKGRQRRRETDLLWIAREDAQSLRQPQEWECRAPFAAALLCVYQATPSSAARCGQI